MITNMNNKNPLISIIILNYNSGEYLSDCISSIFASSYTNIEVLVVDNNSNDDSHFICKNKFPKIILIENEKNLGYCEGNNVGIRIAKGEFIVILNPDTIVESSWLRELLKAYRQLGDGLYQPKILSMRDKHILQSTGNMIQIFGFGFARDKGISDNYQRNKIEKIGYASGTCLFTSSLILHKLELFDPFLFLYHDDLDIGWRGAQIGICSYYVPLSVIYHAESYNLKWSAKKFFWLERNRRYCLLTHYSTRTYQKMLPCLILTEIMIWIFYISKGFIMSKIRAEIEILKNRNIIKKRFREIESKKIIPDIKLMNLFTNTIHVPTNVSNGILNNLFNRIFSYLGEKTKNSILKQR